MGTVHSLDEFRKKKEQQEEEKVAQEIKYLLSTLMLNDDPLIISYEDSNGMHFYDLNDFEDIVLTDSNPYKK